MSEVDVFRKRMGNRDRWVSKGVFKYGYSRYDEIMLVDTGADFVTASYSMARELGLDVNVGPNPRLMRRWLDKGRKNPLEFLDDLWKRYSNKKICGSFECACGSNNQPDSFFYPVEISLNGSGFFKTPVLFVDANINTLMGRIGVFDRFKEFRLDLEKGKGVLS